MTEIQPWYGIDPPQAIGVAAILRAYSELPAVDEGPTNVHIAAAKKVRDTANTAAQLGWLDRGREVSPVEDVPGFSIANLGDAGPTWLPDRSTMDELIAALKQADEFPADVPQRVVGADALYVAFLAHVYVTSVELVDATLGGVNWPALRLFCRTCRGMRRFEHDTCTTCRKVRRLFCRPCNMSRRFADDICTSCGRWYE